MTDGGCADLRCPLILYIFMATLTLPQQALIYYLKKFNLERDAILVITLMLSKSQQGIEAFIYVSHHEQITTQEEFLKLATLIAEELPPEERTGTPMNLRIKT